MKISVINKLTSAFLYNKLLVFNGLLLACLCAYIDLGYNVVSIWGFELSPSAILCPLISSLILFALNSLNRTHFKHLLNCCLIGIYLFSSIVILLILLPPPPYWHGMQAFNVVFQNMPQRCCAIGFSFFIGHYLPYFIALQLSPNKQLCPKSKALLTLFSQLIFFTSGFFILFYDAQSKLFYKVYVDSMLVSNTLMLSLVSVYLGFKTFGKDTVINVTESPENTGFTLLCSLSIVILLTSISTAYQLVEYKQWVLVASGLVFPVTFLCSNFIAYFYGFKANVKHFLSMVLALLVFGIIVNVFIQLPSPSYLNLNHFYQLVFGEVLPLHLFTAALSVVISFFLNALLIETLKTRINHSHLWLKFLLANLTGKTFLCLLNYTILFIGVYPLATLADVTWSTWVYKVLFCLLTLPVVIGVCKYKQGTP